MNFKNYYRLEEVVIDDPALRRQLNEFAQIAAAVRQIKIQLKPLEKKYSELERDLGPVVEALDDQIAQTEESVTILKRKSYEREQVASYKKLWEEALSKVNAATKSVLVELQKSMTEISQVAAKLEATPMESTDSIAMESVFGDVWKGFKDVLSKIGARVSNWWRGIRDISVANRRLRDLVEAR